MAEDEKWIRQIIWLMKNSSYSGNRQHITRRAAHAKTLALLKGTLKIAPDLPEALRIGLFGEAKQYPTWIRISSASGKLKKDSKLDVKGLAIKVAGVKGEQYMRDEKNTQDFVLVNTPFMPLPHIKAFRDALCVRSGIDLPESLIGLLRAVRFKQFFRLIASLRHETSPLLQKFYSITPYAYGKYTVKYCLVPTAVCPAYKTYPLGSAYLKENMVQQLRRQPAYFDLMIQIRGSGMSIEDVSCPWNVLEAPWIKVGELMIPRQRFDTAKRHQIAEQLTFTPGHALKVHAPVGGLNQARVAIYKEMSAFRQSVRSKEVKKR
ncbi:MAG: hypothetical protein ACRCW2_12725 [Cellulosilyticaceae bacterium]